MFRTCFLNLYKSCRSTGHKHHTSARNLGKFTRLDLWPGRQFRRAGFVPCPHVGGEAWVFLRIDFIYKIRLDIWYTYMLYVKWYVFWGKYMLRCIYSLHLYIWIDILGVFLSVAMNAWRHRPESWFVFDLCHTVVPFLAHGHGCSPFATRIRDRPRLYLTPRAATITAKVAWMTVKSNFQAGCSHHYSSCISPLVMIQRNDAVDCGMLNPTLLATNICPTNALLSRWFSYFPGVIC